MKIYSSIIIADKDTISILYECDNQENTRCKRHNNCRGCKYTTDIKHAKDIKAEKTRIELKEELEEKNEEIEEYKETIRRMVKGEDIFSFKTLNEIRRIFNLKPIKNK